jgi:UDP-N-acetylmuramoyl-L-alanyl-D-glutamate--2,6-diaminopimelate ligase
MQSNHGSMAGTVTSLTCDSRQVSTGTLFFALKGTKVDGHNFIQQAIAAGAAAIVLEDASRAPQQIPWVHVNNGRQVMALMAARFFGQPTRNLPLIGITGTNGKTTTSYLVEGILNAAGLPAAVLGTISYRFGEKLIEASHTTPESTELQALFRQLADAGARAFVMEVSSHALEQHRVDGSVFDVGVFTNLTRDHLDYHGSMEAYRDAKIRLFSELLKPDAGSPLRCSVINADDPAAQEFMRASACPVISYGLSAGCSVTAREISSSVSGISAILVTPLGEQPFHSRLVGRYNLSNILAAAAAGVALGLSLPAIIQGIEGHKVVPGRLERVENDCAVTCLVDYAHTGDALENVLSTLKELATGRIITVFGCGGDRDNGKRPIMGRIAVDYSDLAIVTSDNPRTEDPFEILRQVREGILPTGIHEFTTGENAPDLSKKGFIVIENRREAIRLAIRLAQPGDIVLLAGKGHEDYQIIGTVKHHFDDREEAAAAFRKRA